jgi:hypothetical protein
MKTRLPLTLELANPVLLAGDLPAEPQSDFDPKTQLSSATHSSAKCSSRNSHGVQVDVNADVVIDDTIA